MRATRLGLVLGTLASVACSAADASHSTDEVRVIPSSGTEVQAGGTQVTGPLIFDVRTEPPGSQCPAGGTAFLAGYDQNKDGVLQSSEVTRAQYICNGVNGIDGQSPVLKSTPEPIGTRCPAGGQGISWGYDANKNGLLDASEVKQTTYVCHGIAGKDGQNGKQSLVAIVDIAIGDPRCGSAGGKGIYTGLDVDGDGLLQPLEVTASSVVCNGTNGTNGTNGKNALVTQTPEPSGTNCANGGVRIDGGSDANDNLALDTNEITSTTYVCHGAPGAMGAQGPAGASSLVTTTAEAAGANCSAGGTRIDVGPDANGNGVLDTSEIAQTRFVCNGSGGGASAVVTAQTPASYATCPLGGIIVTAGPDATADGKLQPQEVTTTITLCNVARPSSATSCPSGTQAFDIGLDRNLNGTLDDGEGSLKCIGYAKIALAQASTGVNYPCGYYSSCFGYISDSSMCARMTDGTVRCRGSRSASPSFVAGPMVFPTEFRTLEGVENAVDVAVGGAHVCIALAGGTVKCWGDVAQMGNEIGPYYQPAPTAPLLVTGLDGTAAIAAGDRYSCALRTDSTVRCWGNNEVGQLGDGTTTNRQTPVAIPNLSGVVAISAAGQNTCALIADGTVRCWGANFFGQVGDGTTTPRSTPTAVVGVTNAVAVSMSDARMCIRDATDTATCWGRSIATGQPVPTPTVLTELGSVASLAAGVSHVVAANAAGDVRYVGLDVYSQPYTSPVIFGNARFLSSRENEACVVRRDGTAQCFQPYSYSYSAALNSLALP